MDFDFSRQQQPCGYGALPSITLAWSARYSHTSGPERNKGEGTIRISSITGTFLGINRNYGLCPSRASTGANIYNTPWIPLLW